jgi:glycosyltransferase involved in cell wall biosynthesis
VHFLGEKPYSELPKYLYWFDVCIIPFKLTPLIEATHPVKFYEYLSSGKPVVSAKLPELLPYNDLCYLADSKEDFLNKIEIGLKEDNLETKRKRIEFAKSNTWDDRYERLASHAKEIFKEEDN